MVAALFILSMLASIGFIAAYVGLEVHSVAATLRSNLALGVSMSVAFGALAVGAVIWVRYLMPKVELTEERKPLASSPRGPGGIRRRPSPRAPRPAGSSSGRCCGGP